MKNRLSIELHITEYCNMKCTYCFEQGHFSKRAITVNEADNICNRLMSLNDTEEFKKLYSGFDITFWGGEPTTNIKIVKYIYNKLNTYDSNTNFFLYTNGLNILNLKDIIKNDNFSFQISYDGNPIHDKYRLDKNNKPTSKQLIKIFKKLDDNNIKFNIKSTLSPNDFKYINDAYDDICNINNNILKNNKLGYAPTIDYHNNFDLNIEEFKSQLSLLCIKEYKNVIDNNDFVLHWFKTNSGTRCSAGESYFTIDMDGYVYNCHGCLYSDSSELKECNIFDDNILSFLKDRLNNSIYRIPEECKNCFVTNCCRCNVKLFDNSSKKSYIDKWNDISSTYNLCKYFKTISKYKMGLIELLNMEK